MPLHEIVIDAERAVGKTAAPAQPVVDLILRDKVLLPDLYLLGSREIPLFQEQVVQFRPQFLLWHHGAETQFLFPCLQLAQCPVHVGGNQFHSLRFGKEFHKPCMGIRVTSHFQFQFLRHLPHPVTEKEVQVAGDPPTLCSIHQEHFRVRHVGAVFHLGAYPGFDLLPAHGKRRFFCCGSAMPDAHASLVKPDRHLFPVKFKPFPGGSIFFTQERNHFLRRLPLLVLGIDAFPAVLPASPAAEDVIQLLLRYFYCRQDGAFFLRLFHCDIAHLL